MINTWILYRKFIDELLYTRISTGKRPGIASSINYWIKFQSCYDKTHFNYEFYTPFELSFEIFVLFKRFIDNIKTDVIDVVVVNVTDINFVCEMLKEMFKVKITKHVKMYEY